MIPYDELVVALTAWRARQGLPIAQSAAAAAAAPPPRGRAVPPARPAPSRAVAQTPADASELDAGALIEDASYDAGEDYVMQLGSVEHAVEPTAISGAPEPPAARGKRPGW
jgi:hypothetical protein